MKTVILIEEENHGIIGVAKDYSSVVDFLVNEGWLDESFYLRVEKVYGAD